MSDLQRLTYSQLAGLGKQAHERRVEREVTTRVELAHREIPDPWTLSTHLRPHRSEWLIAPVLALIALPFVTGEPWWVMVLVFACYLAARLLVSNLWTRFQNWRRYREMLRAEEDQIEKEDLMPSQLIGRFITEHLADVRAEFVGPESDLVRGLAKLRQHLERARNAPNRIGETSPELVKFIENNIDTDEAGLEDLTKSVQALTAFEVAVNVLLTRAEHHLNACRLSINTIANMERRQRGGKPNKDEGPGQKATDVLVETVHQFRTIIHGIKGPMAQASFVAMTTGRRDPVMKNDIEHLLEEVAEAHQDLPTG